MRGRKARFFVHYSIVILWAMMFGIVIGVITRVMTKANISIMLMGFIAVMLVLIIMLVNKFSLSRINRKH